MNAHTFRALRHRDFTLYFLGAMLSNIGTWMQGVAQGWLVLKLTDSPAWLGTVGFLSMAPSLVLSPLAGVAADRLDRRRLMLASQTVQMLCAAGIGVLVLLRQIEIWHICALVFLSSIALSLNGPAFSATIKDLVGPADLGSGVGLISSQFHLSRAFGPLFASGLIATVSLAGCFLLNAGSFLFLIAALLFIRPGQVRAGPRPGGPGDAGTSGVLRVIGRDLLDALRYSAREPVTRWLFLFTSLMCFFSMPLVTLMPHIVRETYHRNEVWYGYMMAGSGAGALVGALLSASAGSRLGFRAGAATIQGALRIAILMGLAQVITFAVGMTTVQASVPDALRGRVMSLYNLSFMSGMALANLYAGWAAPAWGTAATLRVSGAGMAAVVVLMMLVAPSRERGSTPP
jgi:MFS family permease